MGHIYIRETAGGVGCGIHAMTGWRREFFLDGFVILGKGRDGWTKADIKRIGQGGR